MNTRYLRYLGGAAAARTGDEMSGPALLLLGFAITGSAAAGSALLSGVTIAAAVGGPVFGVTMDRAARPERVLAAALGVYAMGIGALLVSVGRLGLPVVVGIAMVTGAFAPAVAGGWTSQVPRLVSGQELSRASALDALTFSAASLAGPALAAVIAAWAGARFGVGAAAALVAAAVPIALTVSPRTAPASLIVPRPARVPVEAPDSTARDVPAGTPAPGMPDVPDGTPHGGVHDVPAGTSAGPARVGLGRQFVGGFVAILARPRLRRATATSAVSYIGIGMLIVCCPVLGQQRLGSSAHGALLISAAAVVSLAANSVLARRPAGTPDWAGADKLVLASTLVLCLSMAAAAVAPGWLTMLAVAADGAGEGPQLTALFAVRHRESPAAMRGQIFTTAASLKIAGLATGAALAGPLASESVTTCLLVAAAIELFAAIVYAVTG
jgi:MFS family permease